MCDITQTVLQPSSETIGWKVAARNVHCHPINCIPGNAPQAPTLHSKQILDGASGPYLLIAPSVHHVCVCTPADRLGAT